MNRERRRRLRLTRDDLIKMLDDPAFYVAVPALADLRPIAVSTFARYRASKTCCAADFSIARPVVDTFLANVELFRTTDPESLTAIREYQAKKCGYIPDSIMIHYRVGREPKPLHVQL